MPNPRGINQYTKGRGGGSSKSKRKSPPKFSAAKAASASAAFKPMTSGQLSSRSNRNAMRRGELTKWK